MDPTKSNQDEGFLSPYRVKKSGRKKSAVNSWYYFGLAGEIGFTVAIPIAGGAIVGSYIDGRLHSYPNCTIIFLFVGIALSIINFIVIVKSILKKNN